jgi:hypothetical protein
MRFGLNKQSILGLALAGAMGLTMIGSAAAATDQNDVTVSGTVPNSLSLTITNGTVGFSTLAFNACNDGNASPAITIVSNAIYNGSVSATVASGSLGLDQLYRVGNTGATPPATPDCGATTGTDLTGGGSFASSATATGAGGTQYNESYALHLDQYETAEAFGFTLTYSATN